MRARGWDERRRLGCGARGKAGERRGDERKMEEECPLQAVDGGGARGTSRFVWFTVLVAVLVRLRHLRRPEPVAAAAAAEHCVSRHLVIPSSSSSSSRLIIVATTAIGLSSIISSADTLGLLAVAAAAAVLACSCSSGSSCGTSIPDCGGNVTAAQSRARCVGRSISSCVGQLCWQLQHVSSPRPTGAAACPAVAPGGDREGRGGVIPAVHAVHPGRGPEGRVGVDHGLLGRCEGGHAAATPEGGVP